MLIKGCRTPGTTASRKKWCKVRGSVKNNFKYYSRKSRIAHKLHLEVLLAKPAYMSSVLCNVWVYLSWFFLNVLYLLLSELLKVSIKKAQSFLSYASGIKNIFKALVHPCFCISLFSVICHFRQETAMLPGMCCSLWPRSTAQGLKWLHSGGKTTSTAAAQYLEFRWAQA